MSNSWMVRGVPTTDRRPQLGIQSNRFAIGLSTPGHQFLIPPKFTLLVLVGIPSDIAVYVGVPLEDVHREQCDVSDRLHAKDKQHKPLIRYMLLHSMSGCRRDETAK